MSILLAIVLAAPSPISGYATWYAYRPGEAAAGPELRAMLGSSWRGQLVDVAAGSRHVRVRLTDYCACGSRHGTPTLIDLDARSFAELAPLGQGVVRVTVTSAGAAIVPPPTDAAVPAERPATAMRPV